MPNVRVHFSSSVGDTLKGQLMKAVERLRGSVLDGSIGFTHFVTTAPVKGDSTCGFRKSIAALWALAAGVLCCSTIVASREMSIPLICLSLSGSPLVPAFTSNQTPLARG